MFDNFGYEVSKIFKCAESEMLDLKHPYVGSEHLLLSILKSNDLTARRLEECGLTYKKFKTELLKVVGRATKSSTVVLYTPLLKRVVESAVEDASEDNDGKVTTKHLMLAILDEGEGIAIRVMLGMEIELDKIYQDLKHKSGKIQSKNLQLYESGTLLNDYISLNEVVVGRDKEIDILVETLLRKNKNNPLLVGKAGVGKTAIVEELTRRINKGEVPSVLKNSKIVMLEMGALVAGTKYRGEFEEKLNIIIKEATDNKEIILFIDEIHTMVNAGGAEGAINAGDIFKPYLARGDIKCIGATTYVEYQKFIAKDKALDRRFELIEVSEPTTEETKDILYKVKNSYEKHHDVKITKKIIEEIVQLSNKYIHNKNNPDKCIDVLDSVCARVKSNSYKTIENISVMEELSAIKKKKECSLVDGKYEDALSYRTKELEITKSQSKSKSIKPSITVNDVLAVIENKSKIPLMENTSDIYLKVEKSLKKKIFGQEKAIEKILINLDIKLKGTENPMSLLLIGPTGVGKTETVKIVAEGMSKKSELIRIDMSEYNLDTSISKLIGTTAGYVGYDDDFVFGRVRRNPYSVILVDEIEKAHPKILNLFLQILDEGFVTDNKGEVINFQNTFIFMTSNVQANVGVGFNNLNQNNLEEILSKELIGRFDEVVEFTTLSENSIRQYVDAYASEKKVTVCVEDIISICDYQKYGLRNVNNLLKKAKSRLVNNSM